MKAIVSCLISVFCMATAAAVEFEDYDHSRWSQEVTECDRLNYQLGRAYGYSNRGEEAMPYRLKALSKDYPQSTFVIGYLYLIGRTIEQDTCKALELWQRSAKYRRLAALVSLP